MKKQYEYKIIFISEEQINYDKGLLCDVLILDKEGNYFNPQFITLERVSNEFDLHKICYLEDNLVIMHKITKENIFKSIKEMHKWMFYKRWTPISNEQLEKYFFPKENWSIVSIFIDL